MSTEGRKWAQEHGRAHCRNFPARWAVLMAVADHVGADLTGCYASTETLADEACVSKRTAQRHLDALAADGVIRLGDQSRTAHLRADRRPVVWDLGDAHPFAGRHAVTPSATGRQHDTPSNPRSSAGRHDDVPSVHGVTPCPPRGDILSATGRHGDAQTSIEPIGEPPPYPPFALAPQSPAAREGEGREISDGHKHPVTSPAERPAVGAVEAPAARSDKEQAAGLIDSLDWGSDRPGPTYRDYLVGLAAGHLAKGWSPAALRDEVDGRFGPQVVSRPSVVGYRLREKVGAPPPPTPTPPRAGRWTVPWCGSCADPVTRMLPDDRDALTMPCPTCRV